MKREPPSVFLLQPGDTRTVIVRKMLLIICEEIVSERVHYDRSLRLVPVGRCGMCDKAKLNIIPYVPGSLINK